MSTQGVKVEAKHLPLEAVIESINKNMDELHSATSGISFKIDKICGPQAKTVSGNNDPEPIKEDHVLQRLQDISIKLLRLKIELSEQHERLCNLI